MSLLKIRKKSALTDRSKIIGSNDKEYIPCPKCGEMVERSRVVKLKYICYNCGAYFRVKTQNRITMVADKCISPSRQFICRQKTPSVLSMPLTML